MSSAHDETAVRALGEIGLRVRDLRVMTSFYESLLRLPVVLRDEHYVFFAVASEPGGHGQVFALFDDSVSPDHPEVHYDGVDSARSPLHHFAFTIDHEDYDSECERLEGLGLTVRRAKHAWVKARSLYVRDPEDNVVEFVCHDPDLGSS